MPTAAKLVGAIAFGVLGWLAASVLGQALPATIKLGHVPEGAFVAGLACGWLIAGAQAGQGFGRAFWTGIWTGLVMVALVLVVAAVWQMLVNATFRMYPGPFEALAGLADLVFHFGAMLGVRDFLLVMGIGSALAGWVTEAAGRRWP